MLEEGTVSELTMEKKYFDMRRDEENIRWIVERDSWGRMAEALLAQRRQNEGTTFREIVRPSSFVRLNARLSTRCQELERAMNQLRSENKSLRCLVSSWLPNI